LESANRKRNERTESLMPQALPPAGLVPQPQETNERTKPESEPSLNAPGNISLPDAPRTPAKSRDSIGNRRALPAILSIYEGR
jgi:hypothetical protein